MVLFLSVQPAFAFLGKTEQASCSKHCCEEEPAVPAREETPGDPCSDFCNPLLKCGACAASTIEFLTFSLSQPRQNCNQYIALAQRLHSPFAADFWQPPRQG